MDTSELMEKIEKGFTDLRAELGEQMEKGFKKVDEEFTGLRGDFTGLRGDFTGLRGEFTGLRGEFTGLRGEFTGLRGEFEQLKTSVAAKIEEGNRETKIAFENLRHDLKIFDEDSTPGSTITLARRVTSLEGRVKDLEKAR